MPRSLAYHFLRILVFAKPKKRSLALAAREKGLEPLALAIWNKDPAVANLDEAVAGLVNPEKELPSPAEVSKAAPKLGR